MYFMQDILLDRNISNMYTNQFSIFPLKHKNIMTLCPEPHNINLKINIVFLQQNIFWDLDI